MNRKFVVALLTVAFTASFFAMADELEDGASYWVSFPKHRYDGRFASIGGVDFRNLAVTLFDEAGNPELSAVLRDGLFQQRSDGGTRYDWLALESMHYVFERGKPVYAVVSYAWVSAGGSSSGFGVVQLYRVRSGHLEVTQQIRYVSRHQGAGNWFEPNRRLTVRATHYASNDGHCCPSKADTVVFRWTAGKFEQVSKRTTALKDP